MRPTLAPSVAAISTSVSTASGMDGATIGSTMRSPGSFQARAINGASTASPSARHRRHQGPAITSAGPERAQREIVLADSPVTRHETVLTASPRPPSRTRTSTSTIATLAR